MNTEDNSAIILLAIIAILGGLLMLSVAFSDKPGPYQGEPTSDDYDAYSCSASC